MKKKSAQIRGLRSSLGVFSLGIKPNSSRAPPLYSSRQSIISPTLSLKLNKPKPYFKANSIYTAIHSSYQNFSPTQTIQSMPLSVHSYNNPETTSPTQGVLKYCSAKELITQNQQKNSKYSKTISRGGGFLSTGPINQQKFLITFPTLIKRKSKLRLPLVIPVEHPHPGLGKKKGKLQKTKRTKPKPSPEFIGSVKGQKIEKTT